MSKYKHFSSNAYDMAFPMRISLVQVFFHISDYQNNTARTVHTGSG